jgi:hypothetical protein
MLKGSPLPLLSSITLHTQLTFSVTLPVLAFRFKEDETIRVSVLSGSRILADGQVVRPERQDGPIPGFSAALGVVLPEEKKILIVT